MVLVLKDKFIVSVKSELKPLGLDDKDLIEIVDTYIDIISSTFGGDDTFGDKKLLARRLGANCSMMEDVILSSCGFEVYEKYKQDIDDTFIENIIKKIESTGEYV